MSDENKKVIDLNQARAERAAKRAEAMKGQRDPEWQRWSVANEELFEKRLLEIAEYLQGSDRYRGNVSAGFITQLARENPEALFSFFTPESLSIASGRKGSFGDPVLDTALWDAQQAAMNYQNGQMSLRASDMGRRDFLKRVVLSTRAGSAVALAGMGGSALLNGQLQTDWLLFSLAAGATTFVGTDLGQQAFDTKRLRAAAETAITYVDTKRTIHIGEPVQSRLG